MYERNLHDYIISCFEFFTTLTWYGHLKFDWDKKWSSMGGLSLGFVSWGLAFLEYCV